MQQLDWLRRFVFTLLGFVVFGVAGLLFKLVLLPYTVVSTAGNLPRQRRARRQVAAVAPRIGGRRRRRRRWPRPGRHCG